LKDILFLTDLCKGDHQLCTMAVNMCSQIGCNLKVLNLYNGVPYVPSLDAGSYQAKWYSDAADDHREAFKALIEKIEQVSASLPENVCRPQISSVLTEGDLGVVVKEYTISNDIALVIMGAGHSGILSHMLFGNAVRAVIQASSVPVLIQTPCSQSIKVNEKVIFATDFNNNDLAACSYLSFLGERLGFSVEVVHVKSERGIHPEKIEREQRFVNEMNRLDKKNLTYTHLMGGNVFGLLEQWSEILKAGWIALSEHHRPVFVSIFKKSTLKAAISEQKMPLLIFPENFQKGEYFL
jgi:nucleotide-binding universal stress UspA family protein